jgi:CAP12/Pycsar effector protein, TIR domain
MALPVKTTADDVRAIAKYLKTKPTGATVAEVKAIDKQLADGRKLAAFVAWSLVSREDGMLKLSERGWLLARHPDRAQEVFRGIIGQVRPYRSAIEWAHHQDLDSLDANDIASHWHEHHLSSVGDANENTLRNNAVCFFNIAEAAELGTMTLGRGGNPTRLSIDKGEVAAYVEVGPANPPWEDPEPTALAGDTDPEDEVHIAEKVPPDEPQAPEPLRVFISHGSNTDVVEQIEVMLGLADIQAEIAEVEETAAIPVPEKVLNSMRRCGAGIIAVTVDEGRKDDEGNYTLNENVLIEIGAAFVLYDQRVVLLWDKRLAVPSNVQGLYRCEFEGDELSWSAGMKLMKAIQGFKRPAD